jgi:RHS repeat-associated protein
LITNTYYAKDENGIVGETVFNATQINETYTFVKKVFYHNDHLGSTSVITNESGGVIEQTFYEPFGGIVSGGNTSRFDYEGKEFDSLVGEYDFHFRKYSPDLLIFTKPDSMTSNVYDPQALNRYTFEKNNPYKYVDRDGKVAVVAPLLIAAGIGAVVGGITYYATTSAEERTVGGALSYIGGGALAGIIGIGAIIAAPYIGLSTGTAAVLGGGGGGFINQLITNLGTDKPLGEGVALSTVLGAATSGFGQKYLPYARTHLIKDSTSYFTTKTGRTFITNTVAQESLQSSTNILFSLFSLTSGTASGISSNIDLSKGSSRGSSSNIGVFSGTSTTKGSSGSMGSSQSSGGIVSTVNKIISSVKSFFRRLFR